MFTHQGSDWTLDIMPLIIDLPFPARAGRMEQVMAAAKKRATTLGSSPEASDRLRRAQDAIRQYFLENDTSAALLDKFKTLKAWSVDREVEPGRIIVSEYGAIKSESGNASRVRWFKQVSEAIDANHWGATLWVLRGGPFGLDDDGRYDPALFRALGKKIP
jgi:hypothetical protein